MAASKNIPQEKSAAVTRAVQEAFGVAEFEDIRIIKDLAASLVIRIVVRGSPFLLKISMRTGDPARHYTCMRAAAEAGLAPRVWYTSAEDRISIEDFVETVPFPAADGLLRLPSLLRSLHALPPFPRVPDNINTSCMFLINPGPALDAFLERFHAANILPKDASSELFARYAQVAAVYPRDTAAMLSSHNDLFKPDNILFDGRRVWLVDWEAAFLNDCYADLAVVANLVVTSDADERVYLQAYFGESPDHYQLARFFLARQISHMFYAMVFLLLGSSGQPVQWGDAVPTFREFQQQFWAGKVDLTDNHMRVLYGRVHWEQLVRNIRQERFNEALKIVADRHKFSGSRAAPSEPSSR